MVADVQDLSAHEPQQAEGDALAVRDQREQDGPLQSLDRRPRVVICHPGRQYSHQLAAALADAGLLAKYITGVPTHAAAGGRLWNRFLRSTIANYEIPIDPAHVRHVFIAPIVRRLSGRVLPAPMATDWAHRADAMFDSYISRRLSAYQPDVVVASENSALHTFRAAKRLGARTVLDAASFHYEWQDRFYEPVERPRAHRRIVARKRAELDLADHVITVSQMARQSYLEAGVAASKLHVMPLGVDVAQFASRGRQERRSADEPVKFAFVGQIDHRKGIDVLQAAVKLLNERSAFWRLGLFGKVAPGVTSGEWPRCEFHGWRSHERLADELARYDVLILPSRHDSFGMVVAEAMACGLPAIVSENVGAKEMVAPGENGRIIPAGDAAALAEAMAWLIDQRERLPEMSRLARATAEKYDWSVYRRRAVDFFSHLGDHN